MAAVVVLIVYANLIFSNIRATEASTHWVVTEDGKVQSQVFVKAYILLMIFSGSRGIQKETVVFC